VPSVKTGVRASWNMLRFTFMYRNPDTHRTTFSFFLSHKNDIRSIDHNLFILSLPTPRSQILLEKQIITQLVQPFMEHKDSLPCSQEPVVSLCPEPDEYSPDFLMLPRYFLGFSLCSFLSE
jgi:hypothetical protein